jgi:hypothetical protein
LDGKCCASLLLSPRLHKVLFTKWFMANQTLQAREKLTGACRMDWQSVHEDCARRWLTMLPVPGAA